MAVSAAPRLARRLARRRRRGGRLSRLPTCLISPRQVAGLVLLLVDRCAVSLVEARRQDVHRLGVAAVDRPAVGQVREAHRPAQRERLVDDVVLLLARAARPGLRPLARSRRPGAGAAPGRPSRRRESSRPARRRRWCRGRRSCSASRFTSPPPLPRGGQAVGLQQHLEEGVVPADAQRLAVLLVEAGDVAIARLQLGIALGEIAHQARGRHAGGTLLPAESRISGSSGRVLACGRAVHAPAESGRHQERQQLGPGSCACASRLRLFPWFNEEMPDRCQPRLTGQLTLQRAAQPSGQSSKALSSAWVWLANSPAILPSLA